MTLRVPRLPFSLDPLIGEARRRARQRRLLVTLSAVLLIGLATGLALGLRSSGRGPDGGFGPSARVVRGYGIRFEAPEGWHVRVFRGSFLVSTRVPKPGRAPVSSIGRLRPDDVAVLVYEDTADSAWSPPLEPAAYRNGRPRQITLHDLHRFVGGGATPGEHAYTGRNFRLAGRYFHLFVETGSQQPPVARVEQLDTLVRSLRVRPGDFYPGRVAPAQFGPARGWVVRSTGNLPVGTSDYTETVASTVRWSDALNNDDPSRSLARLRRTNGIAILVELSADNTFPPAPRSTPMRLGPVMPLIVAAGPTIPGVSVQTGSQDVGHEFGVKVEVIYGTTQPTREQRARARAELTRLVLPRWPRWP